MSSEASTEKVHEMPGSRMKPNINLTVTAEKCHEYETKWKECLKTLDDKNSSTPHFCNEYYAQYKTCMIVHTAVSAYSLLHFYVFLFCKYKQET